MYFKLYPGMLLLAICFFTNPVIAQYSAIVSSEYNTKRNYVLLNASTGGGDYPFFGVGLTLSKSFFYGQTMIGAGAHYVGFSTTAEGFHSDYVQIFPLMIDIRHKFTASRSDRFAVYLVLDGGYVVSITTNGEDDIGEFEFKNGWAINPAISFRYNVFENTGIVMDLSWFHHCSPREWLSPANSADVVCWDNVMVRWSIFF